MIASAAPQTYSLKSVREMLGLSAGTLTRLIDAGFVTPARGRRNEFRFSFQDVILLRTADQLLANKIPPRKVVKALVQLRRQLPNEAPLTGLRISAVGSDVALTRTQTIMQGAAYGDFRYRMKRLTVREPRRDRRFVGYSFDVGVSRRANERRDRCA